jgi:type VI secretion system secreted protein VgrG
MTMSEHARLIVDGAPFEVVSVRGREALDELFSFEVVCAAEGEARAPAEILGTAAEIVLVSADRERSVHGIVARAEKGSGDDGRACVAVTVVPAAFMLSLGLNCTTFRDQSVVEIADALLAGVPHRWELAGRYEKRAYTAQYREDDWSFLRRQLEGEGIHLWFDHEDGSLLVLSDDSRHAPELAGGAALAFAVDTGQGRGQEVAFELFGEAVAVADRFTVRSFDPARPQLVLEGTAGAGPIEHYDAPGGGPRDPAGCAAEATRMLEAARAQARTVRGASTSVRLVPGRVVAIAGHPVDRYDARYFLTAVTHEITQRRRDADGASYLCRFTAVSAALPYRPPGHASGTPRSGDRRASPSVVGNPRSGTDAPRTRQPGLQSGAVVGPGGAEIYPDAEGRVRVELHWDRDPRRDERSGRWMRVAQRGTADSMLLPRVGWNVLTFNEEGSVDDPSVLSRIHDAEHPPSHAQPANMTRMVFGTKTSPGDGTSNEIHYEDGAGRQNFYMRASRDMSLNTLHDESWNVGNDHMRTIGNEHRLAVGSDASEAVAKDQTTTIAANQSTTVLGERGQDVTGSETEIIAAKRSLHVGAAHQNSVTETRKLGVGSVLIDATLGPISCSSGRVTNVMVGAAKVALTAKTMSESAGLGALQTVGGVKVEIASGARTQTAKTVHLETVGGAMVLKTAGNWTNTTTVGTSWKVGGAMNVTAPELIVDAEVKIVLQSGTSSVTITESDVTVVAPAFKVDGAKLIDADSGRVDHN